MGRQCAVTRGGQTIPAGLALDADSLVLTPRDAPPFAVRLRDIEGIGGDEMTIELVLGAEPLVLSRLGAEAGRLRAALLGSWLPARARALRLGDDGPMRRFAAHLATTQDASMPCIGALTSHALLVAPSGQDVRPLFLAEVASISFDADRWAVRIHLWGGEVVALSRLGGQTDEVHRALVVARAALADTAAEVLGRWLPTMAAPARSSLAATWLPGRFLTLEELDTLATGTSQALFSSWIPSQPRRAQAEALRQWVADGMIFVGYTAEDETARLWLLARRGRQFLLEAISEEDWASYRFHGDDELPTIASRLLCAPQFSREALYLPLVELTGDRAEYAIAARSLPFLRELRECFRGRIVHRDLEAWRAALDAE